jgi:hypothetical protein
MSWIPEQADPIEHLIDLWADLTGHAATRPLTVLERDAFASLLRRADFETLAPLMRRAVEEAEWDRNSKLPRALAFRVHRMLDKQAATLREGRR